MGGLIDDRADKAKVELNPGNTFRKERHRLFCNMVSGAMVDFLDQTLITAAPEYWSESTKIYDDRFARALECELFRCPHKIAYAVFRNGISVPNVELFSLCRNG